MCIRDRRWVCPRYRGGEFQAVVFSVLHLDAPVDQLGSRGVDDVVMYGGRRSIHERACRVWPLSHVGSRLAEFMRKVESAANLRLTFKITAKIRMLCNFLFYNCNSKGGLRPTAPTCGMKPNSTNWVGGGGENLSCSFHRVCKIPTCNLHVSVSFM